MGMKLFEPIQIGALEVPNRIVFPPCGTELAEQGGTAGDPLIDYYARRAEGGAGMIVVEFSAVDDERYSSHRQVRISNDSYIPGLGRLARAIKAHGSRAVIQLHHPGRQNYAVITGLQPIAPSAIPCPRVKEMPREMTVDEIRELIEKYAAAAVRAREAGFDAVQLHGAHGYMICQFLSPFSNKRTDEYGGDTVRRARFATEIIRRCKEMAGSDFPIMLRFSGDEHVPGGLTPPESRQIARLAVEAGADAIDISAGNYAMLEWTVQPQFWPRACLVPLAAAIKPAVSVPLIIAGRINDGPIAERILQEGKADMVSIGRGLIADPDLPRKALAGSSRVHRCIACNTCMDRVLRMTAIRCLVNPEAGVEGQVEEPASAGRKVLVVGGGPSGLEAARVARLRGHEVALWEEAAKPDGPWAYLVSGFVKERLQGLRELGVRVHLGHEVSVAAVAAARPDVALVTQRLAPRPAPFASTDATRVRTADEILSDGSSNGKKIAVLGGDSLGFEVAETMLKRGAAVTLVEPSGRLGGSIESITRKTLLDRLQRDGLQVMAGATPVRLAGDGLVLSEKDGAETTLAVDTVVLAQGYDRDDSLLGALRAAGVDARPLPGCEAPRWVIESMLEGAAIARMV